VKKDSKLEWESARFICVGHQSWGRGNSIKKAQRNCRYVKNRDCVVYEARCEGVLISQMDGTLNWPKGDSPPVIVWMGERFAARNPKRAIGQADGFRNE